MKKHVTRQSLRVFLTTVYLYSKKWEKARVTACITAVATLIQSLPQKFSSLLKIQETLFILVFPTFFQRKEKKGRNKKKLIKPLFLKCKGFIKQINLSKYKKET